MQVIHKLKMDLLRQNNTQIIDAVQLDSNTRKLELSLYEGAMPWAVPDGVLVAIAYRCEDGTRGVYDTLPDDSTAYEIDGNKITITIIPDALAVVGETKMTIIVSSSESKEDSLATFPVTFRVAENYSVDAKDPEGYVNLRGWLESELIATLYGKANNVGPFITIHDTVLDIVGDRITLNTGYIYARDTRISIPQTTVERNTESNMCLLVYDRSDSTVKCISGWDGLSDTQILIAAISNLCPGNENTNYIPGKWSVDGVVYPKVAMEDVEERLDALEANQAPPGTSGLNWYALGDSITRGMYGFVSGDGAGVDLETCWANLAAQYNGWTLTNKGVSGSGYLVQGGTDPKANAREQVDGIDFSGVDLVTLAYGVNDYFRNHGVGMMEDDVVTGGTFTSNMRYCIEKIMTDNPTAKIVVISPINTNRGSADTNWAIGKANNAGATLEDFCNAEKAVCEYYGIEFIDMLHSSVVNRKNITTALPDGVHPSRAIHKQMARELSRKIMSACCNLSVANGGSSGGTDYILPVATPNRLGGVKPVEATDEMTQPVGVTPDGELVTAPGGGSGGITPPATAEIGQTIVVKSVDENGKPTEWEAADLPVGGSDEVEFLGSLITEEEVSSFVCPIASGKYRKLYIRLFPKGSASSGVDNSPAMISLNHSSVLSDANSLIQVNGAINKNSGLITSCYIQTDMTNAGSFSMALNARVVVKPTKNPFFLENPIIVATGNSNITPETDINSMHVSSIVPTGVFGIGTRISVWGVRK